jgi:hypothetical protein
MANGLASFCDRLARLPEDFDLDGILELANDLSG